MIVFVPVFLFPQKRLNRDSLVAILQKSKPDTWKINRYFDLASDYTLSSTESAKIYWNRGKQLIDKFHAPHYDYRYYFTGVKIFHAEQNYEKALEFNLKALKNSEKNRNIHNKAEALRAIFIIYLNLNQDRLAIENAQKALYLTQQLKDTANLPITYGNLSRLYNELGQYEKSVDYGEKGIEQSKKYGSIKGMLICLKNVAISQKELGKRKEAERTLKTLKSIAYKNDVPRSVVKSLVNLSFLAQERGNKTALKLYLNELEGYISKNKMAAKLAGNEENIPFLKGYNLLYQGKYEEAEKLAKTELENIEEDHLMENSYYQFLTKLFYKKGDFEKGEFYERKSDSIEILMDREDLNQYNTEAEKKYQTLQKDSQIKTQTAQLQQRRLLNYLLAGIAFAALFIGILVYRNLRHRQTIQQQKITELETEKQLLATQSLLKGQEEERSRLAKDLHDGLGGLLSGVKLQLGAMKGNLILSDENAIVFDRALLKLDESIGEMRRVAHNMMPETLVKSGLKQAILDYCESLSHHQKFTINCELHGIDEKMTGSTDVVLYRIIQEMVNNAVKHSEATQIFVQIFRDEHQNISVTVEDNGKGFDVSNTDLLNSSGIRNLKSRVSYLKGTIDIKSDPGKGTSVFIECKEDSHG